MNRSVMYTILTAVFLAVVCRVPAEASPPAGEWYRGDLHCHSTYSDGDSSVSEVIAAAEKRGLDFFVITDHDTGMEGKPTHWFDPEYRSDLMILLYGVEWTSERGHANVWALAPFDYTDLWKANQSLNAEAAVRAAHRQGALFSINHPTAYHCCPWEYEAAEAVDFVEIWNAPYRLPNKSHLATKVFWQTLLEQRRVPGVGGSDCYRLTGMLYRINPHGNPTTWIFSEEPTAEAIFAGLKAGHVSISCCPEGIRLELSADADGGGIFEALPGDAAAEPGSPLTLRVRIADGGGDGDRSRKSRRIVIYRNDEILYRIRLGGDADSFTFTDDPSSRCYYRAELRGRPDVGPLRRLLYGRTLALTNPIYVGYGR